MRTLIFWLLSCFLLTLVIGLTYASSQQVLRQGANDPQIQIAEDAAAKLSAGAKPGDVVPDVKVDANQSLSPFVMVFDKNGKTLASNAELKNAADAPPPGVFKFDTDYRTDDLITLMESWRKKNEFRSNEKFVTWQPGAGERFASIIVKYNNGFVLAGRSLREVETRTQAQFHFTFFVWVLAIGATSVAFFLASRMKK